MQPASQLNQAIYIVRFKDSTHKIIIVINGWCWDHKASEWEREWKRKKRKNGIFRIWESANSTLTMHTVVSGGCANVLPLFYQRHGWNDRASEWESHPKTKTTTIQTAEVMPKTFSVYLEILHSLCRRWKRQRRAAPLKPSYTRYIPKIWNLPLILQFECENFLFFLLFRFCSIHFHLQIITCSSGCCTNCQPIDSP